jgi:1-acyl-sn-glycerol-3-phosphate acyltransferase
MSWREGLRGAVGRARARLSPERHEPLLPEQPDARWWASWTLPPEELALADHIAIEDAGHGYDRLGMSREGVAMALAITRPLDRWWFRVSSHGTSRVPAEGPVVVASNHSGTLPLDGMMIWSDLVRRGPPGRVPRVVVDHFVGRLPFFGTLFNRAGAIGGARGNVHEVLSKQGLIVLFPEGTRGIGKPFSERYRLQRWTEGHAELAIRHQAHIVPCAVIGAEEQMPQVARLDSVKLFGAPFLPISPTLVPLPVHYHLWYGEPIDVRARFAPEAARRPAQVAELAMEVREAVAALIAQGLREREGVFW